MQVGGWSRQSIGYENAPAPRHDLVRALRWGEEKVEGMEGGIGKRRCRRLGLYRSLFDLYLFCRLAILLAAWIVTLITGVYAGLGNLV